MLETTSTFALLGGAIGAVDSVPYVRDTWRRSTVPHRGSWLIWTVIELVAVEAQRADGARWSLVPLISQAVGTCVVFGLALWRGSGGVSRVELALIALAGAGVLGWFAVDAPIVATGCVILADFIAAVMMLPKSWRDPHSETMSTFALASLGGVMAVGSVGALSPHLVVYPVYFATVNLLLTLVIGGRRSFLAGQHADPADSSALTSTSSVSRPASAPSPVTCITPALAHSMSDQEMETAQ